ncbi:MAG TPA: tRNA adenosine deaminase-associated protein [Actinomycetales bacterium]|nr:tRNA adenosine deaminase-associated protein [Actinomycetales bacterium]
MSYFSAVIGRHGAGWRALDVDVEDVESLDELADHMRAASHDDGPVLAVLEREDSWFALLRVDAGSDDDCRAFVSDLQAIERSQFAQLLAPVGDLDLDEYAELRDSVRPGSQNGTRDLDEQAEDEPDDEGDDAVEPEDELEPEPVDEDPPPAWAGDPGLLEDLGVSARDLVTLVVDSSSDPGAVLADVGERCGFDDQLDALR